MSALPTKFFHSSKQPGDSPNNPHKEVRVELPQMIEMEGGDTKVMGRDQAVHQAFEKQDPVMSRRAHQLPMKIKEEPHLPFVKNECGMCGLWWFWYDVSELVGQHRRNGLTPVWYSIWLIIIEQVPCTSKASFLVDLMESSPLLRSWLVLLGPICRLLWWLCLALPIWLLMGLQCNMPSLERWLEIFLLMSSMVWWCCWRIASNWFVWFCRGFGDFLSSNAELLYAKTERSREVWYSSLSLSLSLSLSRVDWVTQWGHIVHWQMMTFALNHRGPQGIFQFSRRGKERNGGDLHETWLLRRGCQKGHWYFGE